MMLGLGGKTIVVDGYAADDEEPWRINFIPYIWVPESTMRLEVNGTPSDVHEGPHREAFLKHLHNKRLTREKRFPRDHRRIDSDRTRPEFQVEAHPERQLIDPTRHVADTLHQAGGPLLRVTTIRERMPLATIRHGQPIFLQLTQIKTAL